MGVYEKIVDNPHILSDIGDLARARARLAGVSSFYEDALVGEGIVEELPDGSRRLIGAPRAEGASGITTITR